MPVVLALPKAHAEAVSRRQGSLRPVPLSARTAGGARCVSRQLLQHECPQCPELPPFGLFGDLEQHMRRQHELFCCKLCLRHLKVRPAPLSWLAPPRPPCCHARPPSCPASRSPGGEGLLASGGPELAPAPPGPLCCGAVGRAPPRRPAPSSLQIFTYERKWYSRKDLARHRMQGDPDDTSHRGHPLCKFCDERYLDNDELLKHLRRDHYFCHFCDSDGAQDYYRWARAPGTRAGWAGPLAGVVGPTGSG